MVDARTGAVLTSFRGGTGKRHAGRGIAGTLVDSTLVDSGMDGPSERAAADSVRRFRLRLTASA